MAEDVVFTPVRQLAEGIRARRLSPVALARPSWIGWSAWAHATTRWSR